MNADRHKARNSLADVIDTLNRLLTHALSSGQPLALNRDEIELIREANEAAKAAQRLIERSNNT